LSPFKRELKELIVQVPGLFHGPLTDNLITSMTDDSRSQTSGC